MKHLNPCEVNRTTPGWQWFTPSAWEQAVASLPGAFRAGEHARLATWAMEHVRAASGGQEASATLVANLVRWLLTAWQLYRQRWDAQVSFRSRPTMLIGLGGGVCVGKSSLSQALVDGLCEVFGVQARVLSTDHFLRPRQEVVDDGLLGQLGTPATHDLEAYKDALWAIKAREPVEHRVYTRALYDVHPTERQVLEPADVVVVEGLMALQRKFSTDERLPDLDVGVHLEGVPGANQMWYLRRFEQFCAQGREDPNHHYHRYAGWSEAARETFASMVWSAVNETNAHRFVTPARDRADLVVVKTIDHGCARVGWRYA